MRDHNPLGRGSLYAFPERSAAMSEADHRPSAKPGRHRRRSPPGRSCHSGDRWCFPERRTGSAKCRPGGEFVFASEVPPECPDVPRRKGCPGGALSIRTGSRCREPSTSRSGVGHHKDKALSWSAGGPRASTVPEGHGLCGPVDAVLLAPLRRVGTLAATDGPQAGPVSRGPPPLSSPPWYPAATGLPLRRTVERWS